MLKSKFGACSNTGSGIILGMSSASERKHYYMVYTDTTDEKSAWILIPVME